MGGLETSYLFRVLTKFFVGGCFLWFLFVGGLFFVFCFLTAGVWSVALYLQYLNFFGFLQFFAFFVLPLGLLFLVKVGLRLAFAFLVLALVGLSYMTFLGRASFGASASLFVLVAL